MQAIVVGGGVAGLHTGIKLAKKGIICCIIDEYTCGGRVQTYRNGDLKWENGAGRISSKHKHTLSYIKKYGLTLIPLPDKIDYLSTKLEPNPFFDLQSYLEPLRSLPPDTLATHTLHDIMDKVIPNAREFYTAFPYYAEMSVMRADLALQSFAKEMGSHHGFYVCKEGLSAMIDGMKQEFQELGGTILENTHVESVESVNHLIYVHCTSNGQQIFIRAPMCILAVQRDALVNLLNIPVVRSVTSKLKMVPLLRIYAVFAESHSDSPNSLVGKTPTKISDKTPATNWKPWFADLKSTVVDSPIRYIIPINDRTIMISYTEGPYATHWMSMKLDKREHEVMKEIRRLFPDRTIPDPVFFKCHYWKMGCTYWLPSKPSNIYSVEEESYKIMNPKQNIYVTGESFAVHQCWTESALTHAEQLETHPEFVKSVKALKA
jgi:phytoene dehydrogenase-like protein